MMGSRSSSTLYALTKKNTEATSQSSVSRIATANAPPLQKPGIAHSEYTQSSYQNQSSIETQTRTARLIHLQNLLKLPELDPSKPVSIWRALGIVLGRAVNSALLVASGLAISSGGPGGALVAHAIAILVVYFVMTSLMEVVSAMPSDMPVYMYGVHLLGQPVGVALAWSHWLSWIVIIVYEISASGLIMEFWLPHVNRAIWCSIFFALCIVIVVVGKRPCIFITRHAVLLFTLCTIIAAIILGAVVAAGGIGGHVYGLENWHKKDPPPFLGGIIGIIGASAFAIFSVQGTEHVVPKVVRAEARLGPLVPVVMCCCLALIFIPSVFVTGLLLPSDSEWFKNVTTGDNASENTFAYIFETAGAKPAAHVINAVLLVSAMLDCCACLCYSADMLQDLAGRGLAPKLLAARCDEQGSATAGLKALLNYSLIATCLVSLGIWIPTAFYTTKALAILAGLIGIGGFITWGSIAAMHCVVRWSKKHRNGELAPPNKRFRALLFPVGPLVCLLYAGGVISGLIYISYLLGLDVNIFLFTTVQLYLFILLVLIAALLQRFGYCCC